MKKVINWQGYNQAIIQERDSDGQFICTVQQVDVEGNILKSDSNIGFNENLPFTWTAVDEAYFTGAVNEAYIMECTISELDELGILMGIELSGLKADKQQQILAAL